MDQRPLFALQDPRPMAVTAPLAAIIVPIFMSSVGLLLLFLGAWNNPIILALASVAGVTSLVLCGLIALNRLRNRPVRPSWVAGVMVLTIYLGPATAMVGFVRLLDQMTGIFNTNVRGGNNPRLPFEMDPTMDLLSGVLLSLCATAFIIGCAVLWLEIVALRHRMSQLERAILTK